jgi:hypothetical protein
MGQDGPSICPPSPKSTDPGFPVLRPRFSSTKWLLLEETCDGQWVKSQNVSQLSQPNVPVFHVRKIKNILGRLSTKSWGISTISSHTNTYGFEE